MPQPPSPDSASYKALVTIRDMGGTIRTAKAIRAGSGIHPGPRNCGKQNPSSNYLPGFGPGFSRYHYSNP